MLWPGSLPTVEYSVKVVPTVVHSVTVICKGAQRVTVVPTEAHTITDVHSVMAPAAYLLQHIVSQLYL